MSVTPLSPPSHEAHRTTLAAELAAAVADVNKVAARVQALAKADDGGADDLTDNMRLLTASEVMARTKLSRGAVYALGRRGEAGAVRIGERGIRFSERGLRAWLAAGGSR